MELKVYGVGNVTADPEVRQVGENKTSVCSANLAFNRRFMGGDKEWKDEVCFVQAKLWGAQADKFAEKCKKGTPVLIEGYMVQESWVDKKEVKHTVLVVRVSNFTVCEKNNNGTSATTKPTASKPTVTKSEAPQNSKNTTPTQPAKPRSKPVEKVQEDEELETVTVETSDSDEIPF